MFRFSCILRLKIENETKFLESHLISSTSSSLSFNNDNNNSLNNFNNKCNSNNSNNSIGNNDNCSNSDDNNNSNSGNSNKVNSTKMGRVFQNLKNKVKVVKNNNSSSSDNKRLKEVVLTSSNERNKFNPKEKLKQELEMKRVLKEKLLLNKSINQVILEFLNMGDYNESIKILYGHLGSSYSFSEIENETICLLILELLKKNEFEVATKLLFNFTRFIKGKEQVSIEFFKYLLNRDDNIKEFILNNQEFWRDYFSIRIENLRVVLNVFPESIIKSELYYNIWLERLSSSDRNSNFFDLLWKLLRFMVNNEINVSRSALNSFEIYLIKSNKKITFEQIQFLKDLEIKISTSTTTTINENNFIFGDLKIKLKFFPNNDFSQFDSSFSKNDLFFALNYIKNRDRKDISIASISLFINLASLAYPIDGFYHNKKDFREIINIWKSVLFDLNDLKNNRFRYKNNNGDDSGNKIIYNDKFKVNNDHYSKYQEFVLNSKNSKQEIYNLNEVVLNTCLCLKRSGHAKELKEYITDNIKAFKSLSLKDIVEIISVFPIIGQANFVEDVLEGNSQYISSSFSNYIKNLNDSLVNPSDFPKLQKLLLKDIKADTSHEDFINLFEKIYL